MMIILLYNDNSVLQTHSLLLYPSFSLSLSLSLTFYFRSLTFFLLCVGPFPLSSLSFSSFIVFPPLTLISSPTSQSFLPCSSLYLRQKLYTEGGKTCVCLLLLLLSLLLLLLLLVVVVVVVVVVSLVVVVVVAVVVVVVILAAAMIYL